MNNEPLTADKLDPHTMYCVVSDISMRESVLATGRRIRAEAETTRDFRRFQPLEPIWRDYVRLDCGKFVLAIWRDPTRPELNVGEDRGEPLVVVNAGNFVDDLLRSAAQRFTKTLYA